MAERRGGLAATRPGDSHLRNLHVQALFGMNAERLTPLKNFVVERGPELLGDLFCPWAKWALILLTALIDSDDGSLKLFIARIFNADKSPLQIIMSALQSASEDALRDAAYMADLCTGALAVCRAMIVMLIMVIADLGWKSLICFHIGLFVAQTQLAFSKEAHRLFFHAVHVFLYILDAVAPTSFCRFLLPMAGSVYAIILRSSSLCAMTAMMLCSCVSVMVFYAPLWFGVCVVFAIVARASAHDRDLHRLYVATMVMGTCLCFVRLVMYASGRGFCGAFIVLLLPIVLFSCDKDAQGLVAPLPLVCALVSCLYTPFWVGLCFTSIVIVILAAANDNVKAIMWWFVSFAALHLLSYAFSRNFSVAAICFLGSYFSYGCIL